ncbi:LacI family DNA-binding transcriptional regulator [Chelatococcus asaccharovorans]|uniref:LacI family transcriptional regulator n=1 Tax=Chelatococcus asaccharovorans TaxID=28210 RepID=A0A2V3TVE0_9HYPH|nr:LacI family DNA-binding transcriptional regulator [Chelatococcus asaccharovorans]MBS7702113.1 LacI family DNA-binding transcriptional regulator [Chelatococcus asaccharovorans]PXW52882.1 LacI family transcriptional regulator [Chelatococcus asaccharovorans]
MAKVPPDDLLQTVLRSAPRERLGTTRSRMEDVARLAGVSTATVSRALRQPDRVSPAVRARVDEAVERLSYRRNLMAGALASARSMTIGVIIPSMINSFFSATVEAMEEGLEGSGYQLLIGNSRHSMEIEERLVASVMAWSPAAIVLTGRRHSRETIRMALDADIPIVEMWELSDHPIDTIVGFSQRAAGRIVVRHFAERGARKLGFIGAMLDRDYRAVDRYAGFVEAAAEAGFAPPVEYRFEKRASAIGGSEALRALMAQHPDVDAVFCTNDILALGGLFEAQRQGWSVPGRLRICGFGDLEFAAASEPALTTVRPPRGAIGTKVAEVLLSRLGGKPAGQTIFDLGFELVARGST